VKIEFMLKSISWSSYWLFVIATAVIYYAVVCCKFYMGEIKQFFAGDSRLVFKKNPLKNFSASTNTNGKYNAIEALSHQELMPAINQFINEIKITLEYSAKNNLIKQEIIFSIQHLSKKYALIKNSRFKSFINNYVLVECSNYCSIHLDEDELNMLWEN
jgi:hypothetical protein